ncbi:hypothetical protein F5144DRAFT_11637 [Chaetomium tenue]|uniref:Uncharacterized protein n=1 Tax=Chaetomium tenue TaxID=1854479 RepID=A0ACB7PKM3_9PEZI|nr:hypothetical protein F5144DRAFT_11637 [Chaetomium globosum]
MNSTTLISMTVLLMLHAADPTPALCQPGYAQGISVCRATQPTVPNSKPRIDKKECIHRDPMQDRQPTCSDPNANCCPTQTYQPYYALSFQRYPNKTETKPPRRSSRVQKEKHHPLSPRHTPPSRQAT